MNARARNLALAGLLSIVALFAAGRVGWVGAAVPSVDEYPPGTVVMGSIHIDGAGLAALAPTHIRGSDAVELAATAAGSLADASKPYSVQLAVVTNDSYGPTDERGDLIERFIDHRLSWVVRFTGKEQPIYGGVQANGEPMAKDMVAATELNVVVDALTGETLMMFSFQ